MRPVNLIPPEERRGDRAPLRAGPLAYVVVVALLLAFGGVYLTVSTGNSISERKAGIAALEQELASTEARAAALRRFSDLAVIEDARMATVLSLARSRFDWERVLRELALVIPGDVTLRSLVGAVEPSSAGEASGAEQINAPTLSMEGCAGDHESVAALMAALRDIDGVTRVGLSSSNLGGAAEAAAETSTAGAAGCPPEAASFSIVVAFDGVQIDPATGGVVPPSGAVPGDGSGVAEATQERAEARGSVNEADQKARDAVDLIPGA